MLTVLSECLTPVYHGTVNVTTSGHACQPWGSQTPHTHSYSIDWFPEASYAELANKCRWIMHETGPWCYTLVEDPPWDHCSVPTCPAASNPGKRRD
jgi:apolipoprotein a